MGVLLNRFVTYHWSGGSLRIAERKAKQWDSQNARPKRSGKGKKIRL
jgi:hypothetical protein